MKKFSSLFAGLGLMFGASIAHADFEDLFGTFETDLEESSAQAVLRTYERLIAEEGCTDRSTGLDGGSCTGRIYEIFRNAREIVHTGNDISGVGPTEFSLRANLQGLGFALRWFAAEEYAAQGDMSSDFVSGQVSGLGSRLSALRFGARGFQFVHNGVWVPNGEYASLDGNDSRGGAAGSGGNYSRLGGFLNLQSSTGSRAATGREDAFDSEGFSLTGGLDYRINDKWIVGAMLGYSAQQIDFDSSQSIVDGEIESNGYNIMPFFMYQPGYFYFSGSLGYQQLDFDSRRAISYPSNNLNISSVDTETLAKTDASIVSLFGEVGYSHIWKKMTFEPYFNLNASSITIGEFVEDDVNDDAFDLVVKQQDISTVDYSFGLKTQYTYTPRAGVFIPYLTLEYVGQTDTSSRDVEAYYAGMSSDDSTYFIPTEELDGNYQTVSIGMSAVLRGGRELTPGGSVGGDVQGYFNIKQITGLEGYELTFYTLGFRYAF